MAAMQTIAVIGATGNQGSSVVKTFLGLPQWHVRAITRNPLSEAAQELKAQGAEVVQADLRDPATLPTALAGVHAIFLNTDYWEVYRPLRAKLDAERKDNEAASHAAFAHETTVGKNAIDAAAGVTTLERFVVSSLPSASKASGGKYARSLHTEAKAWMVDYLESQHPLLAAKASIIILGAYNTNPFLIPRVNPANGKYMFALPWPKDMRMPTIDPKGSTGTFVRALIEDEAPGVKLMAYDSNYSAAEIVDAWSRASGKEAELSFLSTQQMHDAMGVGWEHLDAFDAFLEFGYAAGIVGYIEPSQLRKPVKTKTLEEWLAERDWDKVLAA